MSVSGIDGSGKSTLLDSLKRSLGGYGRDVVIVRPMHREPSFIRPLSKTRRLVPDSEGWAREVEDFIGLYTCWVMAATVCESITPRLERGAVVLADRWVADHVTSQTWFGVTISETDPPLKHLPAPDLEILVDCDSAVAQRRIEARGSSGPAGSGADFLAFFRQALLDWYRDRPHLRVDGTRPANEVRDTVLYRVRELLAAGVR